MAINNPEAIRFCNEVVRPLCERVRALRADMNSARAAYDAGIGDLFFNFGAEPVEDGRESEGVSRLVGNDVLAFVALVLDSMKNTLNEPGNAATIAKPCVRSLVT
jgi:hypothetical protein